MASPYWYWRKLKSAWAVDEATSNKFDLPERGHLSALYFKLRAKVAASLASYDNMWPLDRTTLKITGNGNVPILNLAGEFLQASNFWDTGDIPKNVHVDDVGYTMEDYGYIPFGRWLGDEKYGLILENFAAGVEFEEENSFSTSYYTDAESKYDVWGLFRKHPEPGLFGGGFLKKRLIKDKDCDTETQYGVKLPTTNKLRQIFMFDVPDWDSHLPHEVPFTLLTAIWLGILSKEEYILDNVEPEIFARAIHQQFKRRAHTASLVKKSLAADTYIDTQIFEREGTHLTAPYTAGAIVSENAGTFFERVCQAYAFSHGGAAIDAYIYCDAWGILYNGMIPLLAIDPLSDEDAWLDAEENKDVYVEFTEGSGDGHIYIVLDELQKTYPT